VRGRGRGRRKSPRYQFRQPIERSGRYHVVVAADATATRALPGTAGGAHDGVGAAELQQAALATMADRVADVMLGAAIRKIPVKP